MYSPLGRPRSGSRHWPEAPTARTWAWAAAKGEHSTAPFPNTAWQPGENFSFEQLQNCRSTKCDQGNHHKRRGALTLLWKPPILAHTSPPACQTRVHRIASGSQLFPLWFLLLQFLHTITLLISKGSCPKKIRTLKTTENYNLAESCTARGKLLLLEARP